MQKFVVLAALAVVALACADSHAANRRVRTNSAPAGNYYTATEAQPVGPFARLMEMERRKNAALRAMFLGR